MSIPFLKLPKLHTYWKVFFVALGVIFITALVFVYGKFYASVTDFSASHKYLYIPSKDSTLDKRKYLLQTLQDSGFVSAKSINAFKWLADKRHLWHTLKAGRYQINREMSVYEIITLLKSGEQTAVNIVLKKFRTPEQLAGFLGRFLEADSTDFIHAFTDTTLLRAFSLNRDIFFTIVITNTYKFLWTTTPRQFIQRCIVEQMRFWTPNRTELARTQGLAPREVYILASIVEEESNKNDEKPRIASVYLNRLRLGIRLEADPTAKFCTKNFGLRRILIKHIMQDCPYNTYLHAGLPPGPICTPSVASIDAVLHAEKTNYLFFCARPERDGYHNFATNLREHLRNARAFHTQLNKERVFR